jgi:hypothetical protein
VDAFEQIVAELFWSEGYWVRTSVNVNLTKQENAEAGKPTMPRPEIDLVAYSGQLNQMLALECKSYLNSTGVTYDEVCGSKDSRTYKLFRDKNYRDITLRRLLLQSVEQGLCSAGATVQLGMVAGRVKKGQLHFLTQLFEENGWFFRGPEWLRDKTRLLASTPYENHVANVAAKLILND